MKQIFIIVLLIFAVPALSFGQKANSQSRWKQLFNGSDLTGWEHLGAGKFLVENGMLKTEGGMGLLWLTTEKFGNCVIRVVYKTSSVQSNSGVFVRIADQPKDVWDAVNHGYEVQIHDDPSNDEYHRSGAVYSFGKTSRLASKAAGEWNTLEITLKGTRVKVNLNGETVTDFDSKQDVPERQQPWEPKLGKRPKKGYIGLQNHGGESTVYFKEISVRSL